MNVRKLRKRGWSVYHNMIIKEQEYPYIKCVAALKKGKINEVYWSCVGAPEDLKQKFLEELKECKR